MSSVAQVVSHYIRYVKGKRRLDLVIPTLQEVVRMVVQMLYDATADALKSDPIRCPGNWRRDPLSGFMSMTGRMYSD